MAVSVLKKDIVVLDKSNISVTINASGTVGKTLSEWALQFKTREISKERGR